MGCGDSMDNSFIQKDNNNEEEIEEIHINTERKESSDKNNNDKKQKNKTTKAKVNNNIVRKEALSTNAIEKDDIYEEKNTSNNELEETISEIEEKENQIFQTFNKSKENGIELKRLSQYYINPKIDKINFSYSNQVIVTYKKNLNPFVENLDKREDIKEIKSQIKSLKENYPKKQITIKPLNYKLYLDLTQVIENNYNFIFILKNALSGELETFDFNEMKNSILFIIFDIFSSIDIIQKIQVLKNTKKKLKKKKKKKILIYF